ncbi:hypothetical protein CC80DRAFT_424699, partial [Byssothecium circinans]
EVCYILFNLPLTDCSRTILNVNLRCKEDQPKTYVFQANHQVNDEVIEEDTPQFTKGRSVLVKYKERPLPQARPRILKFYPLYSPKLDREDFSRVKLMLHHLF